MPSNQHPISATIERIHMFREYEKSVNSTKTKNVINILHQSLKSFNRWKLQVCAIRKGKERVPQLLVKLSKIFTGMF